ncbi:hypothetical protein FSP39_006028 [Pinctada imbricata]|uniref:RNA-directed DNA polymerase n=1 Tax=Pinctada imbricata TaxID=66713 RepID=A0AA89C256_PINIB|nr:hypothetical protein FSP39_006028 [Pinctada imbricata]
MNNLPDFPTFDFESDKSNAGPKWDRWIGRLENLFVANKINNEEGDDARKRALLLHYCGERVYDIYMAEKGESDETYPASKKVLEDYFKPRKNTQMEIYQFRFCKQKQGQTLDEYVTELRRLSKDCEFQDVNNEILSQLIQNCRSNQLRRRALREPEKGLDDIIKLGRTMELSDSQAQAMERSENVTPVNAISRNRGRGRTANRGTAGRSRGAAARRYTPRGRGSAPRGRGYTKSCFNCGGRYPHNGPCPAKGQQCHKCHQMDHFKKVCKGRGSGHVRSVEEDPDSEAGSDDSYCYVVRFSETEDVCAVKGPYTKVKVNGVELTLLAESGSSVNILDESSYCKVGKPKLAKMRKGKLVPYGGGNSLKVLGICTVQIETKDRIDATDFHVVKGQNLGSILGFPTASKLSIINIVNHIQEGQNIEDDFPHLFKGIGRLKNRQVKLHIDKDIQPVAQKARKTPFHLREKVKAEIDDLLKRDIIEKVEGEPTPWVSPIVTPPKKDPGKIRLCVDMWEPNKAIRRDRHVLPTMEELIYDLNGAKVFSKLDLRCGYHQFELEKDSRYITTFSTHLGIYRYKRLNFRICSASEIFQETVRQVIQNIPGARNISDDILVYGKNRKEHDIALRRVLERLTEHGMTLNGEKCEFRQESVTFFGVVFSGNGISPDPKKVKAVNDFEKPQNVKELKSFLGMTNYCSRFIADYTKICDPLRKLTRKDVDWSWNENCEKAFMELKQSLSSKNVMSYYDPEKPVEVRVDASPIGLGAILAQDKIVAYASRSLTPVESRYSQVEREALAVVWACEHFDLYLRGLVHFKVITDHKPLEKIWKKPQPPLRIERWGLRLQPYKFDIEYSPGEDNAADYMSRHPVRISNSKEEKIAEEYINFIASESLLKAITLDEVKAATMNSPTLQTAISYVRNGRWFEIRDISDSNVDIEELTALRSIRDELTVFADNVLLRGHRIVLPQSLRDAAISIAHEGHQGVGKTKAFLRSKVWFPGLDSRVDRELKDCVACQVLTPERTIVEPLKMSELPSGPWENLSMDFCGPLPSSEYLLVIVDEYTRYPVVEIVKSVSSNATIPIIDKVFSQFGIPKIVKTDNGSPFQSERFKLFMEDMGIMHRRITPRWPRANAQAESFNRPLMKAVKSAHIHKVSWKQEMNRFLRQYRFTPHTSTGYSPYKLLFARDPKTKLPQVASDRRGNLYFDENVRTNDSESKRKMKENTDRQNSAHHRDINIGDSIIVKYDQRGNKLQPVYKPEMKTVLAKKGSMVTISGDITRNMSQVKKV